MRYKIRQLKLGGILDQAIALLKNHFGLLFGILLYVWIPFQLISSGIQLMMMPTLPSDPTSEDIMRAMAAQGEIWPLTFGLTILSLLVVLPITNAAVIYAVAELYLGRTVTAGAALKRALTKVPALIWTAILMTLAIMGGFILLIIPGILFSLWFGLAQHAVVLENRSGVDALSRSKQLVRPNLGTFLILGIVIGIASALIGGGAGFIPQIHLRTLFTVLISSVTTLFSTAAFVVFYFSCRCSVENFDLEHLATSVDSSAAREESGVAAEF